MPTSLHDTIGRPVSVGRQIARGGEGAIYELPHEPASVVKVYHAALDPQKVDKLREMPRLGTPDLLRVAAWPTGTVHDGRGGPLRGIVLPRVAGHREIHQLYNPAQRRAHFPNADWSFLVHVAMNCAAAFETVHDGGHVIGDVNQGGLLVAPNGTVRLIDCDSFQVRAGGRVYYCAVAVPQYTPAELQNADFRATPRTTHHDCFGLALLVFHLLFMGRHPYAGRFRGHGDMTIERAISEGRFAFGRSAASFQMAAPPHALGLDAVSPEVAQLFEQAFAAGAVVRPSAKQWRLALTNLKGVLAKCGVDPAHLHPRALARCPWCAIEEGGGPSFFSSMGASFEFDPGFDLLAVWARIQRTRTPPGADALALPTVRQTVTATPVPQDARHWNLGDVRAVPPAPECAEEPLPPLPVYVPKARADRPPFDLEPLPDEPNLVLETVPPDPRFVAADVPPPPRLTEPRPDTFVDEATRAYRRSLDDATDYRAAKWASLGSWAVAGALIWAPVISLIVGVLSLPFAITWLMIVIPRRRVFRAAKAAATERYRRHAVAYASELRRHAEDVARVAAMNVRARAAWEQELARLAALREGLEERNRVRRAEWEQLRDAARDRRAAAAARNRVRLAAWELEARRIETAHVAEWEAAVRAAECERDAVRQRNADRRRQWQLEMARFREAERKVLEHNRRVADARAHHALEKRRREFLLLRAQEALLRTRDGWAEESRAFQAEFDAAKVRLLHVKGLYERLKGEFESRRRQLTDHRSEGQLLDYLRQTLIEDATIRGIGKGRKATLASYGIETALDVTEESIAAVPGFGPSLVADLLRWRHQMERSFRFDPTKALSDAELRPLHARVQSHRASLRRELIGGDERLSEVVSRADRALEARRSSLANQALEVAQAEADLRVMR